MKECCRQSSQFGRPLSRKVIFTYWQCPSCNSLIFESGNREAFDQWNAISSISNHDLMIKIGNKIREGAIGHVAKETDVVNISITNVSRMITELVKGLEL